MNVTVAAASVARVVLGTVMTGALSSWRATAGASFWAMGIATRMAPVGQASTQS